MTPDIQILSIVQIALIGILVVLGMFFLWRKIQRLEQKVEALGGQMEHCLGDASVAGGVSVASGVSVCPVAHKPAGGAVASGDKNPYIGFVPSAAAAEYDDGYGDDGYGDDEDEDYDENDEAAEDNLFALNAEEEAIVQRMLSGGAGGDPETAATFMVFSPFGFTAPSASSAPSAPQVKIEEADADDANAETESVSVSVSRPMTKTKLSKMNVEQLKTYLAAHHQPTEGTKKQLFERALETITLQS